MSILLLHGQVLSYEPAQKEGRTKAYVQIFDAETRKTFQIGLTTHLDETSIPQTRENWQISGLVIANGKTGLYMTADAMQVLRDAPARRGERQAVPDNGASA